MNAGQMVLEVERRTGVAYDRAAILSALNEAQYALAGERDWPWLQRSVTFSTAAGQDTYALPSDYQRTRALESRGEQVAYVGSRDALTELGPAFTTEGDVLTVVPTPTAVVEHTHRYQRMPPELEADSDESLFPAMWHGALVSYASYIVMERVANEPRAQRFLEDYKGWVRRMLSERRYTGPQRVRVRPGGAL